MSIFSSFNDIYGSVRYLNLSVLYIELSFFALDSSFKIKTNAKVLFFTRQIYLINYTRYFNLRIKVKQRSWYYCHNAIHKYNISTVFFTVFINKLSNSSRFSYAMNYTSFFI